MKKRKNTSQPGFQIGTSYLLVIFVVLCLVTFAALSLSSALRDQSYTEKLAAHQTAYAQASSKASANLARIDEALSQDDATAALQNLTDMVLTTEADGLHLAYTIPVTDSQQLDVTVLADPATHSRQILQWKETARSDWEQKTTLPVIGSDNP